MIRDTDITGEVFGHLTVVGYSHTKKHKSYYECRCDCKFGDRNYVAFTFLPL